MRDENEEKHDEEHEKNEEEKECSKSRKREDGATAGRVGCSEARTGEGSGAREQIFTETGS